MALTTQTDSGLSYENDGLEIMTYHAMFNGYIPVEYRITNKHTSWMHVTTDEERSYLSSRTTGRLDSLAILHNLAR